MNADSIYSATLLVSLVAGGAALVLALAGVAGLARPVRTLTLRAALIAWGALLIAFGVHLGWGHAPGSADALAPVAFLGEHVSFLVALALPAPAVAFLRATARP